MLEAVGFHEVGLVFLREPTVEFGLFVKFRAGIRRGERDLQRKDVAFGVPVRISRTPMRHTTAQIWLGRFDLRMNVIWHPAKSHLRKSRVVSIIMK